MELRLGGVTEEQGPYMHNREKTMTEIYESWITHGSLKSAFRGSALLFPGSSSYTDSVVANHRVAEVASPLPLPVQRLGESSGDFSGARHCGVAGRPGRRAKKRSSGPQNKLPK